MCHLGRFSSRRLAGLTRSDPSQPGFVNSPALRQLLCTTGSAEPRNPTLRRESSKCGGQRRPLGEAVRPPCSPLQVEELMQPGLGEQLAPDMGAPPSRGAPPTFVTSDDDPDTWNLQVFRCATPHSLEVAALGTVPRALV